MSRNQLRILAIAWTILCSAALGSVIVAVSAKLWPLAGIQTLVTASTGFMAFVRWRNYSEE